MSEKPAAGQTFRSLVEQIDLLPEGSDLQIVLRGDLAAILRFAAAKKNPDVLSEAGVLTGLLSQESVVAGKRHIRPLRNGDQNAKTSTAEAVEVSHKSLVAGARNTRFLRLVERQISKLVA